MQNFDPVTVSARLDALETQMAEVKRRLNIADEHTTEAGVGATQASDVVIPAKELGSYEGKPHENASVMDKFLASKAH